MAAPSPNQLQTPLRPDATNASGNSSATLTNDIRDIHGPVAIPSGWEWLWWTLGVLALAALVYALVRHFRKKRLEPAAPEIVLPPDWRARQRLKEALLLLDQPKPFCILTSDTIRSYLEERFKLHAPDRTTEEFLDELQGSALLSFEQKRTLGDFLVRCDLVKFAKHEPTRAELEGIYEIALRLVEETAEPAPAAPAGQPTQEATP